MDQTLMGLVGSYSEVMAMINDPDVDEQTVLDTLDSISGEIEVKADGYAAVLRGIEFERAGLKAKKEYLKGLLDMVDKQDKRLEKHDADMRERLMEAMIATGKDETGIKTERFEFKMVSSGGVQKLEKVADKVPDNFKKIEYKDDDAKIREYLKDHEVDWAWLLPRKKRLDIKGV